MKQFFVVIENNEKPLRLHGVRHNPLPILQAIFLLFICFVIPQHLTADDVKLHNGFNLFSYPVEPPSNLNCDLLQTTLSAEKISRLDTQTQLFESCIDSSIGFPIVPGEGYLIDILSDGIFNFEGAFTCPLIDLQPGLNLIGVPTPFEGMGCFDLLQALGGHQVVSSIQQFTLSSGNYQSCAFSRDDISETPAGVNYAIIPGKAYVVSMKQANSNVQLNDLQQCIPAISPPVITGFSPTSGAIGTLITLDGNNFTPNSSFVPQVTMSQLNGGDIALPISRFNNNQILLTLPPDAESSFLTVTVGQHSVTSNQSFTVESSSSFSFSAEPATAQLIQGHSAVYSIQLSSTDAFVGLAELSIDGLPASISTQFKPQKIAAGGLSLLTLTATVEQPLDNIAFTVSATAVSEGILLSETLPLNIEVTAESTGFMGRAVVGNTQQTPLAGVTVTFLGRDGDGNANDCSGQTISDAAGNFSLTNLPPECNGGQLIRYEGTAVTNQPGIYADVDLFYEINEGFITESPVLIHLPRIDDKETVMVLQNASVDQTFTFATIPGLEVTFYAGTTLTKKDGSQPNPFPFIAMQIPVDRLPDAMPPDPNAIDANFVAFQPANTVASQPVAVTFPNTLRTPSATSVGLMTLDPTKGVMVDYGTATVSADGTQIIPDLDPAFPDHRYGLVHFDWHGPQVPPGGPGGGGPGAPGGPPCTGPCCGGGPGGPGGNSRQADPVAMSTCKMIIRNDDIAIKGGLSNVKIRRFYNNFSNVQGRFGRGSRDNYRYQATQRIINIETFPRSDDPQLEDELHTITGQLFMPNGNTITFTLFRSILDDIKQEGSGIVDTIEGAPFRGVRMFIFPDDSLAVRWKDGSVMKFFGPFAIPTEPFSQLASITDRNGNKTTFIYENVAGDALPELVKIIDPIGRKLTLNYNIEGQISHITDPIGRTVQYTYNNLGAIETFTDMEGGVTRYDYEPNASMFNAAVNLLRITDPRGIVIAQNTFDDNDRVTEQIQADGSTFKFDYTLANPATPFSPLLNNTVTDPLGHQTRYRYNPQGYVLDVTDALGRTTEFGRQAIISHLTSITGNAECDVCGNPQAGDVAMTYDPDGNVLTRTDAQGNITTFTYEPVYDQVSSVTNPLGHVTTFNYDANGNLLSTTDANNNTSNISYNSLSLAETITDSLGQQTTLDYDTTGNLIQITDSLGKTIRMRYDAISRLIATTDALGRTFHIQYDNLNRVIATTDAKGRKTQFQYDVIGNLLSVIDAKGQTTSYIYDEMKRLVSRTDPLGQIETFNYDNNGNLFEHVDRRGLLSQFGYDVLNRLQSESYADGSTVVHSYDARGRLIASEDSISGIITYSYDTLGRLIKSSNILGSLDYHYDNMGRMTSRQVVGDDKVDYSYDAVGNLLAATMPEKAIDFTYDELNRLSSLNRANGVETAYDYDPLNRLRAITHQQGAILLGCRSADFSC